MDPQLEREALQDYERQLLQEVRADYLANDRVYQSIVCHRFVSSSKGWRKDRNGKRVKRRSRTRYKEIKLVKYDSNRFYTIDKAPLDIWATEILGFDGEYPNGDYPSERLYQRIVDLWGY